MSERRYTIRTEIAVGERIEAEYERARKSSISQGFRPKSLNKFIESLIREGLDSLQEYRREGLKS